MAVGKKDVYVLPTPLWKRVFAFIIDIFIITLLIETPFTALLRKQTDYASVKGISELYSYLLANPTNSKLLFFVSLLIAVLSLLYWTVLEYKFGQTIGKMLLKLYVVSEKGKLTFKQCLIRNITKLSTFLIILDSIPLLKPINIQRYSEKWYAKTKVLDKTMVIR